MYFWGKGVCEQKTTDCCLRQSVGQKRSYRGPRGILCTRGEKEHTSKRQSIVACDDCLVTSAVIGAPAGYCVLAGKRSMQAKDNRLLLATIGWSKEKHTTCGRGCSALFVLFIFFITLQSFLLNKHAAQRKRL